MSDKELWRVSTDEYDAFEGKSLEMLKALINSAEAVHIYKDCEGEINIIGERREGVKNER